MNISITITDQNERTTMNFDSFDRAILGLVHEQDWHTYYEKREILNSQQTKSTTDGDGKPVEPFRKSANKTADTHSQQKSHHPRQKNDLKNSESGSQNSKGSADTHSPELKNQETNQQKSPKSEKLDAMPDYETLNGVAPESPKVVNTKKGTTKDIASFHSADNIHKKKKEEEQ